MGFITLVSIFNSFFSIVCSSLDLLVKRAADAIGEPLLRRYLEFRGDPLPNVRRAVTNVLERTLKKEPSVIRFTHEPLQFLVHDRVDNVQRRALLALESNLANVLRWITLDPSTGKKWAPGSKASYPADVTAAWRTVLQIKDRVLGQLDMADTPEMVRSAVLQLTETMAYSFSPAPTPTTVDQAAATAIWPVGAGLPALQPYRFDDPHLKTANAFSLDDVPPGHPVLSRDALSADGRRAARRLLGLLSDNPTIRGETEGDDGGYGASTYHDILARASHIAYCRPSLAADVAAAVAKFVCSPPAHVCVTPSPSGPPLPPALAGVKGLLQPELCSPVRTAIYRILASPASAPHAPALAQALSITQALSGYHAVAARGVSEQQQPFGGRGAQPPFGGTTSYYPMVAGASSSSSANASSSSAADSASRGLLASMMQGAVTPQLSGYRSLLLPQQQAAPLGRSYQQYGAAALAPDAPSYGAAVPPLGTALSSAPHQQQHTSDTVMDVDEAEGYQSPRGPELEEDLASANGYTVRQLLALPELDDLTSPAVATLIVDVVLGNLRFLPPSLPEHASVVASAGGAEAILERLLQTVLAASEDASESEAAAASALAPSAAAPSAPGGPSAPTTAAEHPSVKAWQAGPGSSFGWPACGIDPTSAANDSIRRVTEVALAQVNDALVDPTAAPAYEHESAASRRHRAVVTAAESSSEALAKKAAEKKAAEAAAEFATVVRSCVGDDWGGAIDRLVSLLELASRAVNAAQTRAQQAGAEDASHTAAVAAAAHRSMLVAPLDIIAEALLPPPPAAVGDAKAGGEGQAEGSPLAGEPAAPPSPDAKGDAGGAAGEEPAAAAGGGDEGEEEVLPPPGPVKLTGASLHRLERMLSLCVHRLWGSHLAVQRRAAAASASSSADAALQGDEPMGQGDACNSGSSGGAVPTRGVKRRREEEDTDAAAETEPAYDEDEAAADEDVGAGTGAPSDPLGFFDFTPQCLELLLSLTLAATHRAADRLAAAAHHADTDPDAAKAAATALASVAGGDVLSSFLLGAPSLPPICLDLISAACGSHHHLSRSFRSTRAYDSAFGHGSHRHRHQREHAKQYALSASNSPEGLAISALRDVVVFRPALRGAAIDTLCAIALADSSVDNARRLAQRVLAKRVMTVPGAAAHLVEFCRAYLRRLQAAGAPAQAAKAAAGAEGESGKAAPPSPGAPAEEGDDEGQPPASKRARADPEATESSSPTPAGEDEHSGAPEGEEPESAAEEAPADEERGDAQPRIGKEEGAEGGEAGEEEAPLLLTAGCDAGVSACYEVNDALARACSPGAPLSHRTALTSRLLQLWVALCTVQPELLCELTAVYARAAAAAVLAAPAAAAPAAADGKPVVTAAAAITAASPILAALRSETAPLLRALARSLPGHHAQVLRLLLAGPGSPPGGGDSNSDARAPGSLALLDPSAAPFLQYALGLLADDACDALAPVALAIADKAKAPLSEDAPSPPPNRPAQPATLMALSPVLPQLLEAARAVRVVGSGSESSGSLPFGGFASMADFASAPFAALLPPDELRGLLHRTFAHGSAEAIRYALATRSLRTARCEPPIGLDELGALMIEGGDTVLAREVPLADKLRLVGEITDVLFDRGSGGAGPAFGHPAVLGAVQRTVDRAINRHAAPGGAPPAGQPGVPLLLMKCVLLLVQASPDSRGPAVGALTHLLKRMGQAVFEPPEPGIAKWSAEGNASGASVWDGFVRVVKAALPISFMLLPSLPEKHLRLLLNAKTEGVLRDRFRSWFSTWQARDGCPRFVHNIIADLPPPVAAPPKPVPAPAPVAVSADAPAASSSGAAGAAGGPPSPSAAAVADAASTGLDANASPPA